MNLSRQALIMDGQEIHTGAWPALLTMAGFEGSANAHFEAPMKNHALTSQTFVICASNHVDGTCLQWMEENMGEQDSVKAGGGCSATIQPCCVFLAGPQESAEERFVSVEIDLDQIGVVKMWIDGTGHYRRPEVLEFSVNTKSIWADDVASAEWPSDEEDQAVMKDAESHIADEEGTLGTIT
ncbi:hypothetical protein LTR70_006754 [Exophiala xenobiotica]|uniref:Uncharacterized protein n=1 Tax=Lithohypha guttulata TaxID=1690604 RepID=A0ABR0KAB2_9EURO|nr:hypothetical protein LTR24_005020 [Lithohypha guttulata]KAK5315415.1 hypothetical protein LTR70_006754 [Exophiala xenobiotica]